MGNKIEELVRDLEQNYSSLLLNKESINNIKIELGRIREDVENTDKEDTINMALQFLEMKHTIGLLDDLLHYTYDDLNKNYEHGSMIQKQLFELVSTTHDKEAVK